MIIVNNCILSLYVNLNITLKTNRVQRVNMTTRYRKSETHSVSRGSQIFKMDALTRFQGDFCFVFFFNKIAISRIVALIQRIIVNLGCDTSINSSRNLHVHLKINSFIKKKKKKTKPKRRITMTKRNKVIFT